MAEQQFAWLEKRLESIEDKLDTFNSRMTQLDISVDRMRGNTDRIDKLEDRLRVLEFEAIRRKDIINNRKWLVGIVAACSGTVSALAFALYHAVFGPVISGH